MTTSISVSNPAHASWRVKIEATENDKVVETITLDPNSSRSVTIWQGRSVTISEEPLEAKKSADAEADEQENADG